MSRGSGNSGVPKQDVLVAFRFTTSELLKASDLHGGDGTGTTGNVISPFSRVIGFQKDVFLFVKKA